MLDHPSLSARVYDVLKDDSNEVWVSAASAWEIATKFRIGKLPEAEFLATDVEAMIADNGFLCLPVSVRHGQVAGALPGPQKDPFDRMLIAQAMVDNLVFLSNETKFDSYGVRRLW
jgi:PIN domain nuclease of toxin-antitoxin system